MSEGYWQQMVRTRISRRRTLTAGGSAGLGLAALSLIGCGGGSEEGTPGAKGLISPRTDTTKQAVQGGVLQGVLASQLSSLDSLRAPQLTNRRFGRRHLRTPVSSPGVIELPVGETRATWLSRSSLHLTSCSDLRCARCRSTAVHPPAAVRSIPRMSVQRHEVKDIGDYRRTSTTTQRPVAGRPFQPDRRQSRSKLHSPDS
jgi:hypothetical protein